MSQESKVPSHPPLCLVFLGSFRAQDLAKRQSNRSRANSGPANGLLVGPEAKEIQVKVIFAPGLALLGSRKEAPNTKSNRDNIQTSAWRKHQ
jgi:hypothetical protein